LKTHGITFAFRSPHRFCYHNVNMPIPVYTVYKGHAPSTTIIGYWYNECKRGRTSVVDEEGRPIEATTEETVDKIHERPRLFEDRRDCRHCRYLNWTRAKISCIKSRARECYRLSRLHAVERKRNRMTTSEHCLYAFRANPKEFLISWPLTKYRSNTDTPEMKERSKQLTVKPFSIARRGHYGHRFLGLARRHLHRLFGDGKDNRGAVLR